MLVITTLSSSAAAPSHGTLAHRLAPARNRSGWCGSGQRSTDQDNRRHYFRERLSKGDPRSYVIQSEANRDVTDARKQMGTTVTQEAHRLARRPGSARKLETLGALSSRAPVGHRARRLQRRRQAWDYFPHDHARSRAFAGAKTASPGFRTVTVFALPWRLWNGRIRFSKSGCSDSPATKAITAKMSRSITSIWTRRRPIPT